MNLIKQSLRKLLTDDRKILNRIDFADISRETLKFVYFDVSLIVDSFSLWVNVNDPEDNEIRYMYVIFSL